MSIKLEYIHPIETIKNTYPHIFCKQCDNLLIEPVFCENCCYFSCQLCLINATCCKNGKVIYLGESINGKGPIAKTLEELEIYCPINRLYGCEWIGVRRDYFDHYNKCNKKYQICKFGCGNKIITSNDSHHDTCEFVDKWLKMDKIKRRNDLNGGALRNEIKIRKNKIKIKKLKNQLSELIKIQETNRHLKILDNGIILLDLDKMDINKIRLRDDIKIITTSQSYIPKKTGYIMIVAIGGGSGGSCGMHQNKFTAGYSGFCGEVKAYMVYTVKKEKIMIKIGKGGSGGKSSKGTNATSPYQPLCNKYTHYSGEATYINYIDAGQGMIYDATLPRDGGTTEIVISGISLNAKYGPSPIKIINGKIELIQCNDNDVIINKLKKIIPGIKQGNDGINETDCSQINGKYPYMGGDGGLMIGDDFSNKRDRDGSGFGAGGSSGGLTSFPSCGNGTGWNSQPSYISEEGSDGTDGCVIICYVDYDT